MVVVLKQQLLVIHTPPEDDDKTLTLYPNLFCITNLHLLLFLLLPIAPSSKASYRMCVLGRTFSKWLLLPDVVALDYIGHETAERRTGWIWQKYKIGRENKKLLLFVPRNLEKCVWGSSSIRVLLVKLFPLRGRSSSSVSSSIDEWHIVKLKKETLVAQIPTRSNQCDVYVSGRRPPICPIVSPPRSPPVFLIWRCFFLTNKFWLEHFYDSPTIYLLVPRIIIPRNYKRQATIRQIGYNILTASPTPLPGCLTTNTSSTLQSTTKWLY